jgi:hypothetical protein
MQDVCPLLGTSNLWQVALGCCQASSFKNAEMYVTRLTRPTNDEGAVKVTGGEARTTS